MNTKYNGDILSHNARVVKAGGVVESLDYTNFISEESKQIRSDFFRIYNNPAFCYSLRRLNTAYKGPAIRVRRSSDDAQADINYTLDHELDTETLLSFVGSGNNGFVVTWYDQSGNGRHVSNSTTTAQPMIVSAGTLITVNGKPAIDFDGVNDNLRTTLNTGLNFANNYSFFAVFNFKQLPVNKIPFATLTTSISSLRMGTSPTSLNASEFTGTTQSSSINASINTTYLVAISNNSFQITLNNQLPTGTVAAAGTTSTSHISIAARGDGITTTCVSMYAQELMMFSSKSDTQKANIQNNINSYYNIY